MSRHSEILATKTVRLADRDSQVHFFDHFPGDSMVNGVQLSWIVTTALESSQEVIRKVHLDYYGHEKFVEF